jgi:hypothetical protein
VKACDDEEKGTNRNDRRTHGKPPEPMWLAFIIARFSSFSW